MKIVMMSRWNIPCGVSLHAELIGREWVKMGHDLQVLAPVEVEGYRCDVDEPYVKRCYTLRNKPGYFFDPEPFLRQDCDIFFDKELMKYSGLGEAMVEVFEERERLKQTLRIAEQYVRENSSNEIAKRFMELFESLPEITEHRSAA